MNEQVNPIVLFKQHLEAVVTKEMDMLDDKAKSRMKNAMIVAVTKDPDLLLADRASVFMAARMCASHGVVPDGVEATIQTYNTKVKDRDGKEQWIKKATYLPMIRGIVNRVMRSGKIDLFYAEVVYDGEIFKIDTSHGDRRPIHDPDHFKRGGNIIGAYSVAKYSNGTIDCEPMSLAEINKVRAVAKTKNVWDGWFEEKAKVAVMKRHAKRLPLSAEDMDFILNRDESDFDQPRDVTPEEPKEQRPNLAQRIAAKAPAEILDATPADSAEPPLYAALDTSSAFPGSPAYDRGITDAEDGRDIEDCPYDIALPDAAEWVAGWRSVTKEGDTDDAR